MIYLSGAMKNHWIGCRVDVGIMTSFRPKRDERNFRKHLLKTVWAADNGCFNNPDINISDYLKWLKRYSSALSTCLFATAPDVVADAKATIERALPVLPKIRALGYKAAFVAQDGQENLEICWNEFDCLFIGGSTEWKLSDAAFAKAKAAKRRGKWVHMGRVNSRRRLRIAKLTYCDSTDGTQIAFAPNKRFEQIARWLDEMHRQPFLSF